MSYEYPKAGKSAPYEVKEAIARFHKLPEAEKAELPLLWMLLGKNASTQDYKMSQDDAEYQKMPNGKQRCGNCEFAYLHVAGDNYVCSMIANDIDPLGWCKFWSKH